MTENIRLSLKNFLSINNLLIALLLIVAGFFRFFMLSEIGYHGSDTLYYLSLIRGWTEPLYENFRPVVFSLYKLVYHVWDSDWSIKALNAGFDVFNTFLVYLISLRISKRRVGAWMTAFSYALMPRSIVFARTELTHSSSTTFFLISCAFLVWYLTTEKKNNRLIFLVLSGLFIGLCYGIHEEMLLYVPGMLLCLLFAHAYSSCNQKLVVSFHLSKAIIHVGIFLVTVTLVSSALGFWSIFMKELPRLEKLLISTNAQDKSDILTSLNSIPYSELFKNMIMFNTSKVIWVMFCIFLAVSITVGIISIYLSVMKKTGEATHPALKINLAYYLPWILIFSYLLLYPLSSNIVFPRLFLPAVPLVMMTIFLWMEQTLLFFQKDVRNRSYLFAFIGVLIIFLNSKDNYTQDRMVRKIPPEHQKLYRPYSPKTRPHNIKNVLNSSKYPISGYRMVYNLLKAKVDNRNRLLVTPYIIRSGHQGDRRGFRHYFGNNSVYVEDCVGSLEDFIETMQIRYIVYTAFDNKFLTHEPVCYNLKKEEYTLDKEINLLRSFQSSRTFKYLFRSNEIIIVELIDASSLPNK